MQRAAVAFSKKPTDKLFAVFAAPKACGKRARIMLLLAGHPERPSLQTAALIGRIDRRRSLRIGLAVAIAETLRVPSTGREKGNARRLKCCIAKT